MNPKNYRQSQRLLIHIVGRRRMDKTDFIGAVKRRNIPFDADAEAFRDFADRVTGGKYGKAIRFEKQESVSGFDEYALEAKGGIIDIKATSGTAGGAALNSYLRKYCRYYYGILTQSGELPDVPPDTDGVCRERSVFHYRYAFNYCTFGYSFAFYDWGDWERVTDYLILAGYNLVLNPVGNECVWMELLQKFGYSREEAKSDLSAPNYLPWQWMMNLSGFDSAYPDYWFEEQCEISGRLNRKLSSFGIGVMLPGYGGAVPDDFSVRFPEACIARQDQWNGFRRPSFLLPEDGRFPAMAREYYSLQKRLLGTENVHYYSVDPFHEGGRKEGICLADFARGILRAMKEADSKAVWAFQGWQGNPDREMLSALSREDVLICSLQGNLSADGGDNFCGYPHIYCAVNNFGGQQILRGDAVKLYTVPHKMAKSPDTACCGIGLMPEGVECDECLFDIAGELSVRESPKEFGDFVEEWLAARYGVAEQKLCDAWRYLFEKVYDSDVVENPHESSLLCRPEPDVCKVSTWAGSAAVNDTSGLQAVAEVLLEYYGRLAERESYVSDLTAVTRQILADAGWKYVFGLNEAFRAGDTAAFEDKAEKLLGLFEKQAALADCDRRLNLQRYLDGAAKRGRTGEDREWLTVSAKRLITLWGDREGSRLLHDYAAREYGDMLRHFYRPRWEKYISVLRDCLKKGVLFRDYDRYEEEEKFLYERREYSRRISGDLRRAAEEAIACCRSE